jgi:hypothetical protein
VRPRQSHSTLLEGDVPAPLLTLTWAPDICGRRPAVEVLDVVVVPDDGDPFAVVVVGVAADLDGLTAHQGDLRDIPGLSFAAENLRTLPAANSGCGLAWSYVTPSSVNLVHFSNRCTCPA